VDPLRFRLATRIHFALLRRYGEDVDVTALLKGGREAREALWVCEASSGTELVELAAQFERSAVVQPVVGTRASASAAPQDAAWARNTSGFGVSIQPGVATASRSSSPPSPTWSPIA